MKIYEIPTPALVVDYEKLKRNITSMAERAQKAGKNLRPHIKTHKTPVIAHMQLKAGAMGVACAKLGEAEVMAAAGIEDIFIAYPIVGEDKVERLLNLDRWVPEISTAVDTYPAMQALNEAAVARNQVLDVIVEIEAGYNRTGVEPGESLVRFVKEIGRLKGLRYKGLMYMAGGTGEILEESAQRKAEVKGSRIAAQAVDLLRASGIETQVVGGGSTPGAQFMADIDEVVNEYRPGCYVFGDMRYADLGAHTREEISLTVLATVVSKPDSSQPDHIVMDAGSKALTHMSGNTTPGYGTLVQYPDLHISSPSEEHGVIYDLPQHVQIPEIGEKVNIWPNYVSDTVNYFDELWVVRDGEVIANWDILARGKSV